jgi:hypothetical protein
MESDMRPAGTWQAERARHEARVARAERARARQRRILEAAPVCPICGGRIVGGKCRGRDGVGCGLFYTRITVDGAPMAQGPMNEEDVKGMTAAYREINPYATIAARRRVDEDGDA